jgi:hypothetical protein
MLVRSKNQGAKSSHSVFTLKWLKAKEIQAELESVYEPEALALSTVKKWRKCKLFKGISGHTGTTAANGL